MKQWAWPLLPYLAHFPGDFRTLCSLTSVSAEIGHQHTLPSHPEWSLLISTCCLGYLVQSFILTMAKKKKKNQTSQN